MFPIVLNSIAEKVTLGSGDRISNYEILSPLGAGGMGDVYRARDTKLGRDVALKILPESFIHDPERIARFRREAQVLASLNHPHIGAIYGLDEANGQQFLVLELVDGESLDKRIARGALPVDEALGIAKQIAEALEAAHEKGIIHRDLKPANIALTNDGNVKVLDFGLAKAMEPASATPMDLANSPTITSPAMMTGVGAILGTAAYMSPEQARGKAVDKRTDIWAFGCVLYEMLTGKPVFGGDTLTDVVAAVIKNEPDWSALPAGTPATIPSLLRRCLQRDTARRLQHVGDARIEIEEATAEPISAPSRAATVEAARNTRWTGTIPWVMVAVIAIASGALQLQSRRASSPSPTITRLDLTLPFGVELSSTNSPSVAISPHGERIAFIGALSGSRQLYVRHLGDFDSVPMRGTGIPNICFFSPDGNSLGFITTDRVLKKMALADGLVTPLVSDADYTAGAVWGVDSGITFGRAGNLWRVPAAGGSATQLTTLDSGNGERLHAWPALVEPGKAILFASVTGSSRGATHIEAFSLATGQRHVVMESASFPLYASSGHLIFFRDGALLAAPFDASRLQVAGPAVRVVDNVAVDVTGVPLVTLSDAGTLAYIANDRATRRLVWVSRQGVEQPITETARPYQNPRLAPDGRRIVVEVTGDLWIQDVTRATFTRLTLGDTVGNSFAVWTPDASRIFFRALTGLQGIDADGSGHSQVIAGTSVTDVPTSVSPDGKTLAFIRQRTTNSNADIYVLSLLGEPKPRPVVTTPGYDGGAEFSPDGQWMAYVSNESGRNEVYVRPYPGPDRKVQVSIEGGSHLKWNRSGKELFYRVGNKMMVVDVSTRPDLTLSQPRVLFEQRYAFGSAQTMANYDVSRDGQRFVMVKDDSASGRLSIVLNWFDELKRRVPPK